MMLLSQAAKVLDAQLIGEDVRFLAVSTDSRKILQGDLFVALQGENFDGSKFVAAAFQSGAVAALVNEDSYRGEERGTRNEQQSNCDAPNAILIVKDTRIALGQLAAYWRGQFDIPLVAITGSNGKTTVKEMLAGVLQHAAGGEDAVLATLGNLNNDIGMPLTLLKLNSNHRYAVIEMGMNHPGEIDYLAHIACPDVALITNAGDAHLAGLGSLEAVARAKGEIFSGLVKQGTAIINADDPHATLWRALTDSYQTIEFSLDNQTDVYGTYHESEQKLEADTTQGKFSTVLRVLGKHNARNALAVTAAAIALKVPLNLIAEGLGKFSGVAGRLQPKVARCGARLIDDTYNANPASLRAAISVLSQSPGERVLVFGDMGELGDSAAALHAEIGVEASKAGINKLFTLGTLSRNAASAFGSGAEHFDKIEDLFLALDKCLNRNDTILVKGSRFMKMERIVHYLKEQKCS
jgi:UDP-N-acetylmuramoyl-tripeptide--D-alanyl-D-alanine ligase